MQAEAKMYHSDSSVSLLLGDKGSEQTSLTTINLRK